MTQLFAAYLTQKMAPATISGQYDPEQELWVADNQLQGVNPLMTQTGTGTSTGTFHGTLHQTHPGVADRDTASDKDTDSDTDSDN